MSKKLKHIGGGADLKVAVLTKGRGPAGRDWSFGVPPGCSSGRRPLGMQAELLPREWSTEMRSQNVLSPLLGLLEIAAVRQGIRIKMSPPGPKWLICVYLVLFSFYPFFFA